MALYNVHIRATHTQCILYLLAYIILLNVVGGTADKHPPTTHNNRTHAAVYTWHTRLIELKSFILYKECYGATKLIAIAIVIGYSIQRVDGFAFETGKNH